MEGSVKLIFSGLLLFVGVFICFYFYQVDKYSHSHVWTPNKISRGIEDVKLNTSAVYRVMSPAINLDDKPGKIVPNGTRFLHSSPDEVILAPTLSFLQDVKNPCFAVTDEGIIPKQVTLRHALKNRWRVQCLPYMYLAGFPKCGTTELYSALVQHPMILGGNKELHWWDNSRCDPKKSMKSFVRELASRTWKMTQRFQQNTTEWENTQPIIIEGTPRTAWTGDHWQYDVINRQNNTPTILMPHKIHHVTPQSRVIIIMRDPTSRLVSDYQYYFPRGGGKPGAKDFHQKVIRAIQWWKDCIKMHPERLCLYGPTPPGLPKLDVDDCILNRTHTWQLEVRFGRHRCIRRSQWVYNTADRLRVGLYERFIAEWLKKFPRQQMLFIQFEKYIVDPFTILVNEVFPFLDLPQLPQHIRNKLSESLERGKRQNKSRNKLAPLPETLDILRQFYFPYNKHLRDLLGNDKWLWAT